MEIHDAFYLALRLMNIPSITGTELEIGNFLASYLSQAGYQTDKQEVGPGRFNVMAYAVYPRILFCTHIDTVPPVLDVLQDESFLYGRGACDTKGFIAAMVNAGDRLRQSGVSDFGFLLVVGEETIGDGARAANRLKWESQFVI